MLVEFIFSMWYTSSGAYASCVTRWKWWSWQLSRKRNRFIIVIAKLSLQIKFITLKILPIHSITVRRSQLMSFCWIEVWLQMKRLDLCTNRSFSFALYLDISSSRAREANRIWPIFASRPTKGHVQRQWDHHTADFQRNKWNCSAFTSAEHYTSQIVWW